MAAASSEVSERFGPEPASAGAARRFVRTHLERQRVPEPPLELAILLTSEVVTNAVVHATGSIGVRVATSPSLVRIEVSDDAPGTPSPTRAERYATGGRGLAIVETLAGRWGVDTGGDGKTVWFELPVDADGSPSPS